jgi:hypothetical protein
MVQWGLVERRTQRIILNFQVVDSLSPAICNNSKTDPSNKASPKVRFILSNMVRLTVSSPANTVNNRANPVPKMFNRANHKVGLKCKVTIKVTPADLLRRLHRPMAQELRDTANSMQLFHHLRHLPMGNRCNHR